MVKELNKWAHKYDCCVKCGKNDKPHAAKGLCATCYNYMIRNKKAKDNEKQYSMDLVYTKEELNELLEVVKIRLSKGLPCLKMIVGETVRFLPFKSLDKPSVASGVENEIYLKNRRAFEILKNYYNKITKV